jgi:hypothetical protein
MKLTKKVFGIFITVFFVIVILILVMSRPDGKGEEEKAKERWKNMMSKDCSEWKDNPKKTGTPDYCYGQLWYNSGCNSLDNGVGMTYKPSIRASGYDTYAQAEYQSKAWAAYKYTDPAKYEKICHRDTGFDYNNWTID